MDAGWEKQGKPCTAFSPSPRNSRHRHDGRTEHHPTDKSTKVGTVGNASAASEKAHIVKNQPENT